MECARVEFELSIKEGDGASLRIHLQRLAVNTGKIDPRLQQEWPAAGRALWLVFNAMTRDHSMSGPLPISNREIDAWQRVNLVQLTPWELEMIRAFDSVALEAARKASK